MQDVVGCRIVVADVVAQRQSVLSLQTDFPGARVIDRRDKPSHGYRAVHIIAKASGKRVEIQVRTTLQHLWAAVSERAADFMDPTIKYGGGPASLRAILTTISERVASFEKTQAIILKEQPPRTGEIITSEPLLEAMTFSAGLSMALLTVLSQTIVADFTDKLQEVIAVLEELNSGVR